MRLSLSITTKLLLFFLPLVCLPTAIVGYLSYEASLERVTRLSREEQMLRAEAAAAEINTVFQACLMDLDMITRLTTIEEYFDNIRYGSGSETMEGRGKVSRLLQDFLARSPYYYRIRFLDQDGHEFISVLREQRQDLQESRGRILLPELGWKTGASTFVSDATHSASRQGYVVYFGKPFVSVEGEFGGTAIIELDFERVIQRVCEVRVGERGYAFLVDQYGRTIAHPHFKPYEYNLSKYPDPRMREFVVDMMAGEAGWKTYYYLGEKAAAFAPIPAMGWSVAVTIPIEEFGKEASALGTRLLHVVIATLILTGFVVVVLSYNLLRPVKRLVSATERIAGGDLTQEIAVKSGDELGTLTQSFNRMVRNLREIQNELVRSEKLISLGRISAGVAHEIRNPLNAMKGAITLLQRRRSGDPLMDEYTQIILEEIERLNLFVTEFLYFARQAPPNPAPTNLNDLVQNTLTLFHEKLQEKTISLKRDFDVRLSSVPVHIDARQMGQVIVNLIINALDATAEGGVMEVRTQYLAGGQADPSSEVMICIEDNGQGISNQNLPSIFEPFFSTKENGTGLGLPISVGIVESHGGRLRIVSKDGEGTEAIITLPVRPLHREVEGEKKNPHR